MSSTSAAGASGSAVSAPGDSAPGYAASGDSASSFSAQAFDITGPLPTGTTVLEASAGTGKTHAIVGLAVRYIASGVPISRLLMATFSNAASSELRERTRSRLAEVVRSLADPDAAARSDDPLIALLAAGDAQDVQTRRRHLVAALSDFDSATMATTHTFCNRMLAALGFLGEREQQFEITENVDDIVSDVARDLYLRKFATDPTESFAFVDAEQIAKDAVRHPTAILAPSSAEGSDDTDLRVRFAAAVRSATAERKRSARLRTYDDLQGTLHHIVCDDTVGEQACERIRAQFDVVLIDEFQDTDPQQWDIVRRCFHRPGTTDGSEQAGSGVNLILVGDPKQSIYAFRGAEVLSYLNAVTTADRRQVLTTNYRSDPGVVSGVGTLFAHASLGHPQIAVHPVAAARVNARINSAPAVRIRAFTSQDFTLKTRDGTTPLVGGVREKVIADVAADIAALLASPTTLDDGTGARSVQPGDIAILLRHNKTVEPIQEALRELGIASVVHGGTSIFATAAARQWWHVLQAVEQPARAGRVRLAALTPLIGHTAESLDEIGDDGVGELSGQFAQLAKVFADGGFAAMSTRLMLMFDTHRRVLATADGERRLTDLLQVASNCNRYVAETFCGLPAVTAWLGECLRDQSRWNNHRDQTRRLDRDTQAVQLMTIHGSKGLEFPIVYVPFGWDGGRNSTPTTFVYHDDAERRCLDVGGRGAPGYDKRQKRGVAENAGEELRLLYVAATRARSQVVLWWTPSTNTASGPLHRLLFTLEGRMATAGTTSEPSRVPDTEQVPDDTECVARLRAIAALDSSISVERAGMHGDVPSWRGTATAVAAPQLATAVFDRRVDQHWRRTSYSAIVAAAHAAHSNLIQSGSEPEDAILSDEPDDRSSEEVSSDGSSAATLDGSPTVTPDGSPSVTRDGPASLMNGLPFGAAFGTVVHEVLEGVDTSSPQLREHVADQVRRGTQRRGFAVDVDRLTDALVGVLTTPLGLRDDARPTLWSVAPSDRLSEVEFELPLAGGPSSGFTLTQVATLLDRHLPADDPLRGFVDVVGAVNDERFRGFLTGSVDSVLRTADGFVVVDYKTNRIRPGELMAEDFTTEAMAAEMIREHYPLQALLYSVALHRYLRWRVPGYRPERDLGPVQYHFVRGMVGPQTPPGCGVFEWRIPPRLILDLSDLLAGTEASHA